MKFSAPTGLLLGFALSTSRLAAQAPTLPTAVAPPPETPASLLNPQTPDRLIPGYVGGMGNAEIRGAVTIDATPRAGDFDKAPKAAKEVKPDYPAAVLALAIAGEVKLDVSVDPAGDVREARVSFSPHPEFEAAAVDAALKWKFKPATKAGQPVAARVDLVVHFKVVRAANTRTAVAFAAPSTAPRNYPAEYQYDKPPEVKLSAAAVYPFDFAQKHEGGSATLVFLIDPLGHPRRIEVREATHPEFGAAAAAMIAAWQFTPAKKSGKPTWTMLAKKHTFEPKEGDSTLSESAARLAAELHNPSPSILEGTNSLDAGLKPRYQVAPTLPEEMVAAGASAEAEIEIIVDRAGRVQLPRVVSATREDFGWAAATAVNRWLFVPPLQKGKPVDVRVRVPLSYDAPAKKTP
jgi:TonB family protein